MSDNGQNDPKDEAGVVSGNENPSGERKERKEPPNIDGMYTLKIDNISSRVT